MNEIDLSREVDVEPDGGDNPVPAKNLMCIVPVSVRVFAENFLSKEGLFEGGSREGFVNIDIAGQATVLPFDGASKDAPFEIEAKYLKKLFYFGRCQAPIPIRIQLVESDEKTRKSLDDVARLTDLIGGINAPGAPAVIGAGAGLLGSILRYAKTKVDDDEESVYFGVLQNPLQEQTLKYTLNNSEGPVLEATMQIIDLGEVDASTTGLRISVARPKIELSEERISYDREKLSVHDHLMKRRNLKRFNFEAKSGKYNQAFSTSFNTLGKILSWDEYELFRFKVKNNEDRCMLPISYSFTLNNESLNAEELLGIFNNALSVVNAMGGDASEAEKFLKKNGSTVVGLLTELAKDALSMESFDGVIGLLPPGPTPPPNDETGRMFIMDQGNGKWEKRVTRKIFATVGKKKKEIGELSYDLIIHQIALD